MLRYATGESDFSMLADRRSAANTSVGQKSLDRKPGELKTVAFTNADIARLDAREAKPRRDFSDSQGELSTSLSPLFLTEKAVSQVFSSKH